MKANHRFAVAPMMDRTDRHCRFFHRQLSRNAVLFTEMITAEALIHGDRDQLLGFDPAEHPVALQLGGSEPARLAEAARIGVAFGYDEINLNVGCPSSRVKSGAFGACLMLEPARVARCVAAMKSAVEIPVTVKCRLGVDDQDIEIALDQLADAVIGAGADGVWVHARKAWLEGLNPKQNRTVPPLDYDRVYRLKRRLPGVFVGINGGLNDLAACEEQLRFVDGVMLGRAVFDRPEILAEVDCSIYGDDGEATDIAAVIAAMEGYADRQCAAGVPLGRIVRPMLGLFHGTPGARLWRRELTVGAAASDASPRLIGNAFAAWRAAQDRHSASAADILAA